MRRHSRQLYTSITGPKTESLDLRLDSSHLLLVYAISRRPFLVQIISVYISNSALSCPFFGTDRLDLYIQHCTLLGTQILCPWVTILQKLDNVLVCNAAGCETRYQANPRPVHDDAILPTWFCFSLSVCFSLSCIMTWFYTAGQGKGTMHCVHRWDWCRGSSKRSRCWRWQWWKRADHQSAADRDGWLWGKHWSHCHCSHQQTWCEHSVLFCWTLTTYYHNVWISTAALWLLLLPSCSVAASSSKLYMNLMTEIGNVSRALLLVGLRYCKWTQSILWW